MAAYEPFLIADMKTGQSIGKEPWLTPSDGFPTLLNAYLDRGVLKKRKGRSLYAQMKHDAAVQTTTIMGVKTHIRNGVPNLLVFDPVRVNKYDAFNDTMTDLVGTDTFTGDDKDFFQLANFQGNSYIVNNKDQLYRYDGENIAARNIKFTTPGATNQLNTARFVFELGGRLVLIDTVEYGDWHSNRCRYSAVPIIYGQDLDWSETTGGGFVDAQGTQQPVMAAAKVGQNIVVWLTDSMWRIEPTGTSDPPFRWKKITATEGSRAPYSGVAFRDGAGTIGVKNLLFYDGFKLQDWDVPNLHGITDLFLQSKILYSQGFRLPEQRQTYLTYTRTGQTFPDRQLMFNIDEGNWATFDHPAHCFGNYDEQQIGPWTDFDDATIGAGSIMSAMKVDSREIVGSPYPISLMGGRDGKVYKLNDGTDDAGSTISVEIGSSRLNPYTKENQKARMGQVNFLVTTSATASYTASFYKDQIATAYKTQTLSCSGSGDKHWETIYTDGEVGAFHKIKLSHTAKANEPEIHAIMPFFRKAGRLDL